jgi:Uncharacterized homolog of the cytoplasmic domain of flagellar protein FhlB
MKRIKKAAALSYDKEKDIAPRVVASGRGEIAQKIMDIARENNIPLMQDENTVDTLCSIPLGSEIPEVLYQVIAEIYAYIMRMESISRNNTDKKI